MGRYTGKDLSVRWGTVTLSGDYRTLTVSEETDMVEVSAGSDAVKTYVPTLMDGKAELEILDTTGTTGQTQWAAVEPQTAGTLTWSPLGTVTGMPKYFAPAIVTSREREFPYNDVVSIKISFQLNGPVTETTW